MKITTWNVNGIRSLKETIETVLSDLSSDVLCFQETKVSRGQILETLALVKGYTSYYSYPRKQSGYSGVATYCSDNFAPEEAVEKLQEPPQNVHEVESSHLITYDLDLEGRVLTTYHLIKYKEEIRRLAVINVYCPRVDPDKPERHLYKMQFCHLLQATLQQLHKEGCNVVLVGDLNISATVIDHCDPADEDEFNSSEARMWLKALLTSSDCDKDVGVTDAFRYFYPDKREAYTCWNTKTSARLTNYGTRIDYILVSNSLLPLLQSCEILSDYHGSDHCPVTALLKCDAVPEANVQLPSICTKLWPEFSGHQQTLKAFLVKTQNLADSLTNSKEPPTAKSKQAPKKKQQKSITNFFKAPSESKMVPHHIDGPLCGSQTDCSETKYTDVELDISGFDTKSVLCDENVVSSTPPKNANSAAWKTVLCGPPKPPLCSGHQKECVMRTVKKKGPNYGRNFFMCAQPAGQSSNPEANCNFFKWATVPKINKLHSKS